MTTSKIRSTARRSVWRLTAICAVLASLVFLIEWLVISLLGGSFSDALVALPGLGITIAMSVFQMIGLMIANFMLFFGPFLLYARIGLDDSEPGDASWDVKISDVRGQPAAVGEMRKILNLIERGKAFVMQGGTREKGVLMSGPPGTGKTMLAKAIASELQLPILVTSGASFAGMFFGMDVLKVLMMSRLAKKKAKKWGGCIVFIDELDAIGQRRSGGPGSFGGMFMGGGGQMALNMLLVVMDGLDSPGFFKKRLRKLANNLLAALFIPYTIPPLKPPKHNVFFMAATNRAEVLDEAITRPGRFGRKITFKNPDLKNRLDILNLYLSKVKHDDVFDFPPKREEIAAIMEGYSPATIQQTLSMALMYAFEHERDSFNWNDLREAMANIEVGMAEPIEFHAEDALVVARHEISHALALKVFVPDQMPTRLSIRPRGNSLGHLSHSDRREQFVFPQSRFEGLIRVSLASTAVERAFYGENFSGVQGDLEHATFLAARMASSMGMGMTLEKEPKQTEKLGATLISLPFQPGLVQTAIQDTPTRRRMALILGYCYQEVEATIHDNLDAIDRLARKLIERKELVGHEIDELFSEEVLTA